MPHTSALVGPPGAGADASIRRFHTRVRVPSAASGDAACVLEHALPPGCVALPMHRHPASEVVHVLTGTLRLEIGTASHALAAGTSAVIPPGTWHTYWTHLDEPSTVRFLAVCAPGGMDRYYADVASRIPRAGAIPDINEVRAVGDGHGVEVDMLSLYDLVERYGVELS